jgi:hypothetical protein
MSVRPGAYLAGLWSDCIVDDLMWCVCPQNLTTRPKPWQAPSWSWMSVDSRVMFEPRQDSDKTVSFCRVSDAICKPSSQNLTGQVSPGYMKISGCLIQATMEEDYTNENYRIAQLFCKHYFFLTDYNLCDEDWFKTRTVRIIYFLKIAMIKGHIAWLMALRCVDAKSQVYERIGAMILEKSRMTGQQLKTLQTTKEYTTIIIQ